MVGESFPDRLKRWTAAAKRGAIRLRQRLGHDSGRERRKRWERTVRATSSADLLERWTAEWEQLARDVHDIHLRREIFRELDDELVRRRNGSGTDLVVARFLRPMYGDAQTVALRRLNDRDTRSTSFHNLLSEMILRPEVVTRSRYVDLAAASYNDAEEYRRLADEDFDDLAGPGSEHLAAATLRQYRNKLGKDLQRVAKWVNTSVAHRDRVASDAPTWGVLDEAIDSLEEHMNAIGRPLLGVYRSATISIQSDWRAAFRGLFPPGDR